MALLDEATALTANGRLFMELTETAEIDDMSGAAGAAVVAEMIETEDQARLMHDLGAKFGQGWLYGRPGLLRGAALIAAY